MIYNFVTIFNNLYLPQAINLHKSLKNFSIRFKLWAICIDKESYNCIKKLSYKTFVPINFSKYENKKLDKLKKERSVAEYCWTITPMSPKLVFNLDKKIKFVTYVDADMYFLKNPKLLINTFLKTKKKISFTNHDFNENEKFKEKTYGKFCVQFMTFKKKGSEKIRKIWEKKCIEWCFATPSKGRMGDQKYLENIYKKYNNKIYVLDNDFFRSTWNYKKINFNKIVAWHFHGFKIINRNLFLKYHHDFLPEIIVNKIYIPYIKSIKKIIDKINFKKTQLSKSSNPVINLYNNLKFILVRFSIFKKGKYWFLN